MGTCAQNLYPAKPAYLSARCFAWRKNVNVQPYQQVVEKPRPAAKVHPWVAILVAMSWAMVGFLFCLIIEMLFDIELSKLVSSIINFAVACFGLFYLFPKLYASPFGPIPLKEYLQRLGFFLPPHAWRHVLLGIILAGCTLSGMLAASILTGRYVLDWGQINLTQFIFSLTPGIFEEAFYRGIIMILLLHKVLKKGGPWANRYFWAGAHQRLRPGNLIRHHLGDDNCRRLHLRGL